MMDQQLLKNHTIGYNTVSSVDGIINARGVKSKPNNIEIMGYTHEVGEGEKSPDNPYVLQSLDSGATDLAKSMTTINLFIDDNGYLMNHPYNVTIYIACSPNTSYIINRTKYQATIQKNIACSSGVPKNGLKVSNSVPFPKGDTSIMYTTTSNASYLIFQVYLTNTYVNDYNNNILYKGLSIYEQNGHSIKITNNDKTIQVPTPTVLHSVAGKSDILTKNGSIWGIKVRTSVFNSDNYISTLKYHGESSTGTHVYRIGDISPEEINGNIFVCISNFLKIVPKNSNEDNIAKLFRIDDKLSMYIRYQHSVYPQFSSVEVLKEFLLENPIEIIFPADAETFIPLSDYAQQLLNSFELQNQNEISVEGLPEIKISGYIQN